MSFDNYLKNVIGLRTAERVRTIREHGMENFDTLAELEADDVKGLIHAARRADSRLIISALIEKRCKLACYGARIYTMIDRRVTAASLSLSRLKEFEDHRKIVEGHKDPTDEIPKVSKSYGIDKALDMLPNYLRTKIGVRGVALSYVIRESEVPAAHENLANEKPYADKYESLMQELIVSTPHDGVSWEEDNSTVFSILQEMVRDSPMASSLKRHQKKLDGRGAYLSLVQHNLGSSQWDKIILRAEEIQNNRIWNGRNSRYTLKKHIDMHRDAYNDMVRATEHVQYEVPNEHTRVSRLLRSVQAGHIAAIAAAKTTIEAYPTKRDDFEEAADFLILNAPAGRAINQTLRISALESNSGNNDKTLDDYNHVSIDDRFYTKEEYGQLTNDQKHKLKLLRDSRTSNANNNRGNKRKQRNNNKKKKFKKLKTENNDLRQRIAALESSQNTNNNNSNETSNDRNNNGNESNNNNMNNGARVRFNQRETQRT